MTPKAPAQQVMDILNELGMNQLSQFDLERVAEHLGVELRYASLDGSAANIIGVGENAIVTIDETSTPGRKRFSAGHEIGHWIYDKGKGLYLCKTQDLNEPWNSRAKRTNAIEKRANRFAAELLMPATWFREAVRGREMSFDTVEELKDEFQASRTSTAIRLVEMGTYLALLVMFDSVGRRKWYCGSKELPERFYPCRSIPRESRAWEDIVRRNQIKSEVREVDGNLWIDHPRAFEIAVFEQAIRVGDNVLVMVWILDDKIISEIIESDEYS